MKLRSGAREGGLAEDCSSCRGLDWLDRIRAWHAYLVSRRLSIRVQERAKRAGSQEVFARPHRPPVLTLRPYLPLPTHDARQRQATLPRQRFLLRKILSPVRLPPRPITSTASSRSSTFRTQAPIRRLGPPLENAAFKRHHTRSKRRIDSALQPFGYSIPTAVTYHTEFELAIDQEVEWVLQMLEDEQATEEVSKTAKQDSLQSSLFGAVESDEEMRSASSNRGPPGDIAPEDDEGQQADGWSDTFFFHFDSTLRH